jgi:hypothetical protein
LGDGIAYLFVREGEGAPGRMVFLAVRVRLDSMMGSLFGGGSL